MQTSAAMLTKLECLGIIALLYTVSQYLDDKKLDQTTVLFTGIFLLGCYMQHCGQDQHGQQEGEQSEHRDDAGGALCLLPARVPDAHKQQSKQISRARCLSPGRVPKHAVLPWQPTPDFEVWEQHQKNRTSFCFVVTGDQHCLLLNHTSYSDDGSILQLFGPAGGEAKFKEKSGNCSLRELAEEIESVHNDVEGWLQTIQACIAGNAMSFEHFYQYRGRNNQFRADMWMLYIADTVLELLSLLKLPNRQKKKLLPKQLFQSPMSNEIQGWAVVHMDEFQKNRNFCYVKGKGEQRQKLLFRHRSMWNEDCLAAMKAKFWRLHRQHARR